MRTRHKRPNPVSRQADVRQSSAAPNRRRYFITFTVVYILLTLLVFDPKLTVGGDNAVYLILANSLTSGAGYRTAYLPDQPEHTLYPPGFPVLLSLLQRLTVTPNVLAAKALVILLGALGVLAYQRTCARRLRGRSWLATSLLVSVPVFLFYSHHILTEVPFLGISMAALYCLYRADSAGHQAEQKAGLAFLAPWWWAGFACAIAGFLLRTAGISLILGVMLFLALRKRYLHLATFLALFLAVLIPLQMHNARAGGQPYLNQFLAKNPYLPDLGPAGIGDFAVRIAQNLIQYCFGVIPQSMCALLKSGWLSAAAGALLSGLVGLGFILTVRPDRARRRQNSPVARWTVVECYFVIAVAVLLGWPALWAGERFLLPLLPILVIYIVTALIWLEQKVRWKYLAVAVTGILLLVNLTAIGVNAFRAISSNVRYLKGDRLAGYTPDWRRYFECIEWMKDSIPKDAIVLARKPEFVYLLSARRSFCPPFTADREAVLAAIEKSDYILFDNFEWTNLLRVFLAPVLKEDESRFGYVFKTEEPVFLVLKVGEKGRGRTD